MSGSRPICRPDLVDQHAQKLCQMLNKQALRRNLRARRRQLSPGEQRQGAQAVCRQLRKSLVFRRARHIAIYWPAMGEIDLRPLLGYGRQPNQHFYLPVVSDRSRRWEPMRLLFQRTTPHQALTRTNLGIEEPAFEPRHCIAANRLDLVLMPLVGFDPQGNRLGMGKGYYDRTFDSRRGHWRQSRLLGVAYAFQEVAELDAAPWDVPLHGVVTDGGLRWFS